MTRNWTPSANDLIEVISHEAIVPYRYIDSVGVNTDGVGHTKAAGGHDPAARPFGVEIPLIEVLQTFKTDLKSYVTRVNKYMTRGTPKQKGAGLSFDFNTGGIGRATWVKSHNAGNEAQAAAQIMNWTTPPEITERRRKEQILYRDGKYSNNGFVTIIPADSRGRPLYAKGKRIDARPIVAQLMDSVAADDSADQAKKTAIQTGGGGIATGGASTQTDSIPKESLPTDSTALKVFLLLLAIGLAIVAIMAIAAWIVNRRESKNLLQKAADLLGIAHGESVDVGTAVDSVGTRGLDPERDS